MLLYEASSEMFPTPAEDVLDQTTGSEATRLVGLR